MPPANANTAPKFANTITDDTVVDSSVQANANATFETVAAAPAPVHETKKGERVGPITEEDIVNQINDLISEWSNQNQDVAKIDVQLGSYRTLLQTQRTVQL